MYKYFKTLHLEISKQKCIQTCLLGRITENILISKYQDFKIEEFIILVL